MHFDCQCIERKSTNRGHYYLRLLLATGPPFYKVIRATRRSTRLHCKGSTRLHFSVILRPKVLVRPRESNPRPSSLQSNALPTELTLPLNSGLYIRCKETDLPLGSVLSFNSELLSIQPWRRRHRKPHLTKSIGTLSNFITFDSSR